MLGGEGTAVFDSVTASLQGLFPPTDDTVVITLSGGYQYIPIRALVDVPSLVSVAHLSFLSQLRPLGIRMIRACYPMVIFEQWTIWDYINNELSRNDIRAQRLPSTYINQTRALVNWREDEDFSDMNGISACLGDS